MSNTIEPIVMPKWGLAMTEGAVTSWNVNEGDVISSGDEICEIETSKLANMFESPVTGPLRSSVADADIDAFVTEFLENFVPEETDDGGPEPEAVTVDGKKMMYLKLGEGDGTPVVLVHGFGADMNGWLFNQTALSEAAPVYALDLPGHGKSEKDVGDGTLASLAGSVTAFLKAMSLNEVHLVGHSMGGGVILNVALDNGSMVKSLTLIDSVGLGSDINIEFLNGFLIANRQKKLRPVLESLVSDKALISTDMMEDVLKFKRIDGVVPALEKLISVIFSDGKQSDSFRDELASLSMPVSVIWGKDDEIIPVEHCENLPNNVTVNVIEKSGHVPQLESAAQVNDIILSTIQT